MVVNPEQQPSLAGKKNPNFNHPNLQSNDVFYTSKQMKRDESAEHFKTVSQAQIGVGAHSVRDSTPVKSYGRSTGAEGAKRGQKNFSQVQLGEDRGMQMEQQSFYRGKALMRGEPFESPVQNKKNQRRNEANHRPAQSMDFTLNSLNGAAS